jgi:hypothetical protein
MLHELSQQFDRNKLLSWISNVTGLERVMQERAESSFLPEGSLEQTENLTQLQTKPATLRNPLSVIKGASNFLFIPAPFFDNGSFFLNLQSYESFAWYLYYLLLLILLVRFVKGRYLWTLQSLASTLFTLGIVLLSSLVEINDGTSVRHRSVLLIGILIMLSTFRHKNPEYLSNRDSNSNR